MGNTLRSWQSWVVGLAVVIIVFWIFTNWKDSFEPILKDLKKSGHDIPFTEIDPPGKVVKKNADRSAYRVILESSRDCVPSLHDMNFTPPLPNGITSEDWEDTSKRSKGELECKRVMEKIYGVPFTKANAKVKTENSITLPWLKNDLPGGRLMEIDVYNHELKIGVEYNGEQHYKFPHIYNKNIEAFRAQQYRDRLKLDLCDSNGVYVITVPYNVKLADIEGFIRFYLPDAVAARQARMQQLGV